MKIYREKEAKEKGLIQLSSWLFDNNNERELLKSMYNQVMRNKERIAMVVYNCSGNRIALFVNNIVDKFKYVK